MLIIGAVLAARVHLVQQLQYPNHRTRNLQRYGNHGYRDILDLVIDALEVVSIFLNIRRHSDLSRPKRLASFAALDGNSLIGALAELLQQFGAFGAASGGKIQTLADRVVEQKRTLR